MEVKIRKREVSCLEAAVLIGFCVVLKGGEVFLASMKGMPKFWEDTVMKK